MGQLARSLATPTTSSNWENLGLAWSTPTAERTLTFGRKKNPQTSIVGKKAKMQDCLQGGTACQFRMSLFMYRICQDFKFSLDLFWHDVVSSSSLAFLLSLLRPLKGYICQPGEGRGERERKKKRPQTRNESSFFFFTLFGCCCRCQNWGHKTKQIVSFSHFGMNSVHGRPL